MAYQQISLEFDRAWVERQQAADKTPIKTFLAQCGDVFGSMDVVRSSQTECVVWITQTDKTVGDVKTRVESIASALVGGDNNLYRVRVEEVVLPGASREPTEAPLPADGTMAKLEALLRGAASIAERTAGSDGEAAKAPAAPVAPCKVETEGGSVEEKVASLIGATEFKDLLSEVRLVAPRIVESKSFEVFASQSYLFSIDNGCGLTTYLELFAQTLAELRLFEFSRQRKVVEIKLAPPSGNGEDPFAQLKNLLSSGGQMVCLDISEWMTRLRDMRFIDLLTFIEDNFTKNVVVFRVPFVEEEVRNGILTALQDVLCVRPVSFVPMDASELLGCAKRALSALGFTAEEDAWAIFNARVAEEKQDGRFYGINTVRKVVREMVYRKQLYNAVREEPSSTEIKKQEITSLVASYAEDHRDGMAMLRDLVGIEKIIETIEEILSRIDLSQKDERLGAPCLHMRFVGSPGTGKTTVARILGRILKERGVLRNGGFFEYTGRDLCGEYIGSTAPKTAAICRDAYGSVLFIDEAYSLYRGGDDRKDYGREALEALIAEMENHRKDMVVIMAGYSDEMATLMKGNPGLESRMPYIIEFPNYSRENLYGIFLKMMGDLPCGEGFKEEVKAYFDAISEKVITSKTFSNARFVRNLFERTCSKAGNRCRIRKIDTLTLTKEDFALASSERSFQDMVDKKETRARIGF